MELCGKTALVTGAGSGIGRAIACELGRHGARVVCSGRGKDRLDDTVRAIAGAGGVGLAVSADVTEPSQVSALVDLVLARYGHIDILFNNAGSFQCIAGVHELDVGRWWHDVTVNLYGPLCLIRAVLPGMLARDAGLIINMDGGRPVGGSGYACGKAGLMELTRLMAAELRLLGSSVTVLSAGPGLVRTEMTEMQANSEAGQRWIPSTREAFEAGNLRQPEEIARTTVAVIRTVTPAASGKSYGPDSDVSTLG